MKSRKLRALALALSAIMTITAVPSTLFAEDFVGGEVEAWDDTEITEAEAPAEATDDFGFGSDVVVEDVAPAFDDAIVEDDKPAVDLDLASVKFYYNENGKEDGTVEYKELDLSTGNTIDEVLTCSVKATVIASTVKDADCENGKTFKMGVIIPGYEKYQTITSETFTEKGSVPLGHAWGDEYTTFHPYPTCSATGTSSTERKCTRCNALLSEVITKFANIKESDSELYKKMTGNYTVTTSTVPATGNHTFGTAEVTYQKFAPMADEDGNVVVEGTKADKSFDPIPPAYLNHVKYNDETCIQKTAPTIDKDSSGALYDTWGYYEVTKQVCSVCKKTFYTVVPVSDAPVTQALGTTENIAPAGVALLTDKIAKGQTVEDKDIALIDCTKPGKYEIVYTKEEESAGIKTVTVAAHHTAAATRTYVITDADYKALTPAVSYTGVITITDADKGDAVSRSCKDVYYTTCYRCVNYATDKAIVGDVEKKVAKGSEKLHIIAPAISSIEGFTALDLTGKTTNKWADVKKYFVVGDKYTEYADFSAVTCANGGLVKFICANCGAVIPDKALKLGSTDHVWGTPEVIDSKPATCTEDGYIVTAKKCQNPWCSETKDAGTKVLAKKGHDFVKTPATATTAAVMMPVTKLTMPEGSVIIGGSSTGNADLMKLPEKKTYSVLDGMTSAYDDKFNASLYAKCVVCGAEIVVDDVSAYLGDVNGVTYTVKSVVPNAYRCKAGSITISATYVKGDKEYTDEKTYEYWKSDLDYAARTSHEPDATGLKCKICGDPIIPETPVAPTTVAPTTVEPTTVVTTEAPTTVAPTTAAPTTEAPTTTAPTTEAPVVPTTVAPVTVEPTTEITTVEPATMPAQVTGEKVTKNSPTTGTIGVKYNAVEGADSYTVNVREPNGAWTKNPTNGAETAYEITGLTEGKCYDIRIAAVAAGIAGPRSGHLYRWLKKVTLMKPTKIKGEAGAVNVTWDAADGASKYKLYVSSDKAFKKDVKKFTVAENTAKVTGLQVGTKYYFKVRCYTKGADGKTYTGGWSNVKSKTLK